MWFPCVTASVGERCSRLPSSKGRTVEENNVVQLRSDLLRLEDRGRVVRRVPADLNPDIPGRSERRESRESLWRTISRGHEWADARRTTTLSAETMLAIRV